LDEEYAKQELAKDVSGLANSAGGIIILGASTEIDPAHSSEVVMKVSPFPSILIQRQRYHDILREWTYPPIDAAEVQWFPCLDDPQRGIAAIVIRAASPANAPHLVTKVVDTTGRVSTVIFGYFERKRSVINPMSAQQVHSLIQGGLRTRDFNGQFESISMALPEIRTDMLTASDTKANSVEQTVTSGGLQPVNVDSVDEKAIRDRTRLRLRSAIGTAELATEPLFGYAATPLADVTVPDLFKSRTADVVKLRESDYLPIIADTSKVNGSGTRVSKPNEGAVGTPYEARESCAPEVCANDLTVFVDTWCH
jgi:hypothetical protein